jgi:translation initiation factor 1 (eIF-1/SUI1)
MTRAKKIVQAVGSIAKVEINQAKPGKGNFVVRVSGVDEPIVELTAMKRPFPALKALDMDEVSRKVLTALEGQS